MPRCLMAKKWKAYPWADRADEELAAQQPPSLEPSAAMQTDDEEIDVVGDADLAKSHQGCWGPHSPTAGATAPSPPPLNASGALYYHGYTHEAWLNHEEPPKYATLRSAAELARPIISTPPQVQQHHQFHQPQTSQQSQQHNNDQQLQPEPHLSNQQIVPLRKSLSMCFTSTGTALSLPPKKKDIYRPYSLPQTSDIRSAAEEDLSAAQAILDLSASPAAPSHSVFIHTLSGPLVGSAPQPSSNLQAPIPISVLVPVPGTQQPQQARPAVQTQPRSPAKAECPLPPAKGKTVAYTYEAFFVSDGRSKRRAATATLPDKEAAAVSTQSERPKFKCTECGKQYATSSNLSRHKQTHRSLDSQSAKKCIHCGKAYVSMPALAMHVLTHKLAHSCGVCGKMFSRPWLLQGHLRSHTGEKPYGCAHCGKAFADRSNLRAHMQTHSTDKNYECSRCHKTFALKSYLNKHLESACLRDDDASSSSSQQVNRSL